MNGAPDWGALEAGRRHLVPEHGTAAGEPHPAVPVAPVVLVAEACGGGVGERIAVVGVGEVVQLGRIGGTDVGSELAAGVVDDGAHIDAGVVTDRKSTRLNSSHLGISYAVFCL